VVYNQDDDSSYVYIVYSGTFEISRKQVVPHVRQSFEIKDLIGPTATHLNLKEFNLNKSMEFNDVRIAQSSLGEIIGLEDVFLNRKRACTVRCVSSTGSLYKIKSEEFMHKIKKDSRVLINFQKWISDKD
jgi:CRP-like cAMP-binding protein